MLFASDDNTRDAEPNDEALERAQDEDPALAEQEQDEVPERDERVIIHRSRSTPASTHRSSRLSILIAESDSRRCSLLPETEETHL